MPTTLLATFDRAVALYRANPSAGAWTALQAAMTALQERDAASEHRAACLVAAVESWRDVGRR